MSQQSEVEKAIAAAQAAAASQRTNLWDKVRLGRFTASQIYKLMGDPKGGKKLSDGAESYIYAKIAEELTGFEYQFSSAATDHGEEYEPAAIDEFMRLTGQVVTPVGFIPYLSFAGGSPDGLIGDHAGIEVKCPANTANHIQLLAINSSAELLAIAKDYWWQCQANMLFTGRNEWYFITFSPYVPAPLHIGWIKLEADHAAQARLVSRLELALRMKTELVNILTLRAGLNQVVAEQAKEITAFHQGAQPKQ